MTDLLQQTNNIMEVQERKRRYVERCRQFITLAHARISLIIYRIFVEEILNGHIALEYQNNFLI